MFHTLSRVRRTSNSTNVAWSVHVICAAVAAMIARILARMPGCKGLGLSKHCLMHLSYHLHEQMFHMTIFSMTNKSWCASFRANAFVIEKIVISLSLHEQKIFVKENL